MAILGIDNRTENWKTARHFVPVLLDSYARAELAWKLGEPKDTSGSAVKLELFWKGMRDYRHQTKVKNEALLEQCAGAYSKGSFQDLCGRIQDFNSKNPSRSLRMAKNYDVPNSGKRKDLFNNLLNTEIDIVLETPNSLLIGEAKGEAGLGTRGAYVLVHQLVRQYVMASIFLKLKESDKKVVPFLVVEEDRRDSVLNTRQVGFMISQGWLDKEKVLTWAFIERLRS